MISYLKRWSEMRRRRQAIAELRRALFTLDRFELEDDRRVNLALGILKRIRELESEVDSK